MGSNKSRYDQLHDNDDDYPLFKELQLVVIGCHSSGKNDIGNVLLRKKKFTYFTSFEKHYVKKEHAAFGTKITVVRLPGWSGDLSSGSQDLKQEIKDALCEFEKGPHALLWAVDIRSIVSRTTQNELQRLLSSNIWEHVIIIFTNGHKANDHSSNRELDELLKACNMRCYTLKKPYNFECSKELNENIALCIAEKKPLRFSLDAQSSEISERKELLQRVNYKIDRLCKRVPTNSIAQLLQRLKNIKKRLENYDQQGNNTKEDNHLKAANVLGGQDRKSAQNSHVVLTELQETGACSSNNVDRSSWINTLIQILDELTVENLNLLKTICNDFCKDKQQRIPRGKLEKAESSSKLAQLMIEHWGDADSISYMEAILKNIHRNDLSIIDLITPFSEKI